MSYGNWPWLVSLFIVFYLLLLVHLRDYYKEIVTIKDHEICGRQKIGDRYVATIPRSSRYNNRQPVVHPLQYCVGEVWHKLYFILIPIRLDSTAAKFKYVFLCCEFESRNNKCFCKSWCGFIWSRWFALLSVKILSETLLIAKFVKCWSQYWTCSPHLYANKAWKLRFSLMASSFLKKLFF